jgi:hypothetical protein
MPTIKAKYASINPAPRGENPKSIMRRTAIGTVSVAAAATLSATSAAAVRPLYCSAKGINGASEVSDARGGTAALASDVGYGADDADFMAL